LYGLNLVGLKRKGFTDQAISTLKKAYKIIFRSGMTQDEALQKVSEELTSSPEAMHLVEFIKSSKRGVTR
jgi:UDP-N-acetylglucosamine acyltransferase